MYRDQSIVDYLADLSEQAAKNAYCPYSHFNVGSAVYTSNNKYYTGCNVENVSFGHTICAERNAICNAVTVEGGEQLIIQKIAVFSSNNSICAPCGGCRQVIYEFGKDCIIYLVGKSNEITEYHIQSLLPHPFDSF